MKKLWIISGACALAVHVSVARYVLELDRAEPRPKQPPIVLELQLAPEPEPEPKPTPPPEPEPEPEPKPEPEPPPKPEPEPEPEAKPHQRSAKPKPLPEKTPPADPAETSPASDEPTPKIEAAPPSPKPSTDAAPLEKPSSVLPETKRARTSDPTAVRAYAKHLHRTLANRRHYPVAAQRLGHEGQVKVAITLNRSGHLVAPPEIRESSGSTILDEDAIKVVKANAPYPGFEEQIVGASMTFVIPMKYQLRR